jgi:hypothetical protein
MAPHSAQDRYNRLSGIGYLGLLGKNFRHAVQEVYYNGVLQGAGHHNRINKGFTS